MAELRKPSDPRGCPFYSVLYSLTDNSNNNPSFIFKEWDIKPANKYFTYNNFADWLDSRRFKTHKKRIYKILTSNTMDDEWKFEMVSDYLQEYCCGKWKIFTKWVDKNGHIEYDEDDPISPEQLRRRAYCFH